MSSLGPYNDIIEINNEDYCLSVVSHRVLDDVKAELYTSFLYRTGQLDTTTLNASLCLLIYKYIQSSFHMYSRRRYGTKKFS